MQQQQQLQQQQQQLQQQQQFTTRPPQKQFQQSQFLQNNNNNQQQINFQQQTTTNQPFSQQQNQPFNQQQNQQRFQQQQNQLTQSPGNIQFPTNSVAPKPCLDRNTGFIIGFCKPLVRCMVFYNDILELERVDKCITKQNEEGVCCPIENSKDKPGKKRKRKEWCRKGKINASHTKRHQFPFLVRFPQFFDK